MTTKLIGHVADESWDALVCVSPENVAYAAGLVIPSQPLMRWRHAAIVITRDGQEAMVCVDMEESTLRSARPEMEIRSWSEFTGNAMETLAELLHDLGLSDGQIGIELAYLAVRDHERLKAATPGVGWSSADEVLNRSRQIKTEGEIESLRHLSRISDRAIQDALTSVKAGDTEMDIAAELTRSVYTQGAQSFKLMIVATGERSSLPNVGPSARMLVPGDVCRVEIFSVIDGYQAGVCRTAIVGEPPPGAIEIYANLVECRDLVMKSVAPGVQAKEIYALYRRHFDLLGLPAIGFVGHGIGVNLHEAPYLGPNSAAVLETGMVLGVEPLVYRTKYGFGMQIKDMIAVDASGVELLSDVTDTDNPVLIEA